MHCFELLLKHFALCGIEISQKISKSNPVNVKNLTVLFLLCVHVSSMSIMLKDVNTFDEITDILFLSVSYGALGIFYLIVIWKTSKLLKFIDNLADTVNASK